MRKFSELKISGMNVANVSRKRSMLFKRVDPINISKFVKTEYNEMGLDDYKK